MEIKVRERMAHTNKLKRNPRTPKLYKFDCNLRDDHEKLEEWGE